MAPMIGEAMTGSLRSHARAMVAGGLCPFCNREHGVQQREAFGIQKRLHSVESA